MEIAIGTCRTPAALSVSKKCPSEVLASPMVPKATSSPLWENPEQDFSPGLFLNNLEANASPSNLGICPAVGEMSAEQFFCLVRSFHFPSLSSERVAKWLFIRRPPVP